AASLIAIASKFIVAWRGKHLFNPAAVAVVITSLALNFYASWWVGTLWMLPWVLVGGLLVVKKIQRFDLVLAFFAGAVISIAATTRSLSEPLMLSQRILVDTPILFLAFIMLTEPFTTPPTRGRRIVYGAFVGLLFAPGLHFGEIYFTPERALVVG